MFPPKFPCKSTMHQKTHPPIAPSGRELAPKASEGASGQQADGLHTGWYLLTATDIRCHFHPALSSNRPRKRGGFGEVPSPAVQWALHPQAPSGLGLCPKPPPSRREVFAEAFCKYNATDGFCLIYTKTAVDFWGQTRKLLQKSPCNPLENMIKFSYPGIVCLLHKIGPRC